MNDTNMDFSVNLNSGLAEQVKWEVADKRYTSQHGTAKCYQKGCRGPLCRWRHRVRAQIAGNRKPLYPELDSLIKEMYDKYTASLQQERESA